MNKSFFINDYKVITYTYLCSKLDTLIGFSLKLQLIVGSGYPYISEFIQDNSILLPLMVSKKILYGSNVFGGAVHEKISR